MKTYQIDNKANYLYFANYERIDEQELSDMVLDQLKLNGEIVVGEKEIGPSEDIYKSKINSIPFTLFCDLNYGPFVFSESINAIEKLKDYFNQD